MVAEVALAVEAALGAVLDRAAAVAVGLEAVVDLAMKTDIKKSHIVGIFQWKKLFPMM